MSTLFITDEREGRRYAAYLGAQRGTVSATSWTLLLELYAARKVGSGWLQIPNTPAERKAVSRLRQELQTLHPEARSWVENDGKGGYRLSAAAPPIEIRTTEGATT